MQRVICSLFFRMDEIHKAYCHLSKCEGYLIGTRTSAETAKSYSDAVSSVAEHDLSSIPPTTRIGVHSCNSPESESTTNSVESIPGSLEVLHLQVNLCAQSHPEYVGIDESIDGDVELQVHGLVDPAGNILSMIRLFFCDVFQVDG